MASANEPKIQNEAFKEIGICSKAIKITMIAIKDGCEVKLSLFFEVNLFREA